MISLDEIGACGAELNQVVCLPEQEGVLPIRLMCLRADGKVNDNLLKVSAQEGEPTEHSRFGYVSLLNLCAGCPDNPSNIDSGSIPKVKAVSVEVSLISERERQAISIINDPTGKHFLCGKFTSSMYDGFGCAGTKDGSNPAAWGPDSTGEISANPRLVSRLREIVRQSNFSGQDAESRIVMRNHQEIFVADAYRLINDGKVVLAIVYTDTSSNDHRPGVYTEYAVEFPIGSETIRKIESDPSLLIDMMKMAFPKADRSPFGKELKLAEGRITNLN